MCNVCFYIYKNIYISIQRTKKMNLYQETFNIYRKETGRKYCKLGTARRTTGEFPAFLSMSEQIWKMFP